MEDDSPVELAGKGILSAVIWPTFVGLAEALSETVDKFLLRECLGDPGYDRGQITWVTEKDGSIWGHGRVCAPKGVYTHILYATAPTENVIKVERTEHPIVFDRPGFVDINPIRNTDYLPRGSA